MQGDGRHAHDPRPHADAAEPGVRLPGQILPPYHSVQIRRRPPDLDVQLGARGGRERPDGDLRSTAREPHEQQDQAARVQHEG